MKISFSGTLHELKHFFDIEVVQPLVSQLTTRITQMSEIQTAKINELQAQITILVTGNADLSAKLDAQTDKIAALTVSINDAKTVQDHVVTLTTQTVTLLGQVKDALDQAGSDAGTITALQAAIDNVTAVNASIQALAGKVDAGATAVSAANDVAQAISAEGQQVSQTESDAVATNAL